MNYTAHDGDWLTGTLVNRVKVTIAQGATVTLKNVNINADGRWGGEGMAWPGIECEGDATIVLAEGTTSTVRGISDRYAGISVPSGHTLTLRGPGTLNAIGGSWSAGIGASYNLFEGCGNIVIESGTINATGGSEHGAGIGNTIDNPCGDITITGGTVTATGLAESAPGIGAGENAGPFGINCGKITITGGTITATGGANAAGIGNGNGTQIDAITITTGITSITATHGNGVANAIGPNGSDENLCPRMKMGYAVVYKDAAWQFGPMTSGDYGHLTLVVSGNTWTLTPAVSTGYTDTKNITSGIITVPNGAYWRVTGATDQNNASTKNNRIIVEDGAMVMLSNLTVDGFYSTPSIEKAGVTCLGDAVIVLDGTNAVNGFGDGSPGYPGIHIAKDYTLVIRGSGSLTASSSSWGAGIGDDSNGRPSQQPFDETRHGLVFVENMIALQWRVDAVVLQQHTAGAGVFGKDKVDRLENLDATKSHVAEVSYRCWYQI